MTLMPVSKISGAVTRSVNGGGARWMGSFTCALTSPRLSTGSPSTFRSRPRQGFPTDRKSTRLNSSHSQISYAVFCLKKKDELLDLARLLDEHVDRAPVGDLRHRQRREPLARPFEVERGGEHSCSLVEELEPLAQGRLRHGQVRPLEREPRLPSERELERAA